MSSLRRPVRPGEHERPGVVDGEQPGVGVGHVDVAVRPGRHLVADPEREGDLLEHRVVVEGDGVGSGTKLST